MRFELNKEQLQKLNDWKQKIKQKHGLVDPIEYRFTPTGIGTSVIAYSTEDKSQIDLTEYEKW